MQRKDLPSLRHAHHRVGVAMGSLLARRSNPNQPRYQAINKSYFGIAKKSPYPPTTTTKTAGTNIRHRRLLLRFSCLGVLLFSLTSFLVIQQHNNTNDDNDNDTHVKLIRLTRPPKNKLLLQKNATPIQHKATVQMNKLLNTTRISNTPAQETSRLLPTKYRIPKSPHQELEQFLQQSLSVQSPGIHFILLLQHNLCNSHNNQEEYQRWLACHATHQEHLNNVNLCLAGAVHHKRALSKLSEEIQQQQESSINNTTRHQHRRNPFSLLLSTNASLLEQQTPIKLKLPTTTWLKTKSVFVSSVYDMRRYGPPSSPSIQHQQPERPPNADIHHKLIPNLGTSMACLPLVIAGAAVAMASASSTNTNSRRRRHLVVELGPYFGLSSKCIVSGIRSIMEQKQSTQILEQNQQSNDAQTFVDNSNKPLYFAYDTFAGSDNLRSLQDRPTTQWIIDDYFPSFSSSSLANNTTLKSDKKESNQNTITHTKDDDTSFLFLWQRAVWPIYPTAQAIAQKLDILSSASTTNAYQLAEDNQWKNQNSNRDVVKPTKSQLSLLVIDSAKNAKSWDEQLSAVLGNNKSVLLLQGSILILMDFQFVAIQVKQVYGCLRHALLPVYISWNKEHWAFVVTQDIALHTGAHQTCYQQIANQWSFHIPQMEQQVWKDLQFVSSGLIKEDPSNSSMSTNQQTMARDKSSSRNDSDVQQNIVERRDKDPWKQVREDLYEYMTKNLRDKPEQWTALAKLT